jgi:4-carboxymuconolactone decarboxylase
VTDEPQPGARDSIRALVALSAAVAGGDRSLRRAALQTAHGAAPARAIEEALLQTYLFLGFPAALTALAEWRDISGRTPSEPGLEESLDWSRRGEAVCRTVYGRAYEKLRGNVRRVHPAMDDWMVREGYGKVLGREGLDLGTRELCIVSMLAATGWEPQLHSHLRGALNTGCDELSVGEALEAGLAVATDDGWRRDARSLWARVRDRREGTAEAESPEPRRSL